MFWLLVGSSIGAIGGGGAGNIELGAGGGGGGIDPAVFGGGGGGGGGINAPLEAIEGNGGGGGGGGGMNEPFEEIGGGGGGGGGMVDVFTGSGGAGGGGIGGAFDLFIVEASDASWLVLIAIKFNCAGGGGGGIGGAFILTIVSPWAISEFVFTVVKLSCAFGGGIIGCFVWESFSSSLFGTDGLASRLLNILVMACCCSAWTAVCFCWGDLSKYVTCGSVGTFSWVCDLFNSFEFVLCKGGETFWVCNLLVINWLSTVSTF